MIKKYCLFLMLFPLVLYGQLYETVHCYNVLELFRKGQSQASLYEYAFMNEFFLHQAYSASQLLKMIRFDMKCCKKMLRTSKDYIKEYNELIQELAALYTYVVEHQVCCKALQFHEALAQKYKHAFTNQDIVHALYVAPELYGVENIDRKCRAYLKKIASDLKKIDKFEHAIHADYEELKARNHVYRIELLKLRNIIYRHPMYKFEISY